MMFDEMKYNEMFAQVKASEGLTRRVTNMKQEKKYRGSRMLGRMALITAVVMLMALTVSASESVQSWFVKFFASINRDGLTPEQVEYIEDNAQTILDSKTQNGWTVELHSAIRDERKAYIIFRVAGPEDVDLSQWKDEAGNLRGQVSFANLGIPAHLSGLEEIFDFDEHVEHGGWGYTWMDDGDGKEYTENLVFHLEARTMHDDREVFGEETVYHFRFQDIIWYWRDMEYEQKLNREKYPGQGTFHYTDEESRKIHRWETLAEGVWEFEISFGQLKFVEGGLLKVCQ